MQWWWIAVPVVVAILISVLAGVFIYMHRRNSVQAALELKAIEDQLADAEKLGIQIPEDLGKSFKGNRLSTTQLMKEENSVRKHTTKKVDEIEEEVKEEVRGDVYAEDVQDGDDLQVKFGRK